MIEVTNLSFQYDRQVPLINDLNFTIPKERITAIVGPNGSGKTTLLKLLTRTLKPVRGSVILDQQSIWDYAAKEFAQHVAIVHQHNPLYDVITVRELIDFGQLPYTDLLSAEIKANQRTEKIIQKLGLAELIDRPMGSLSGGQQQLVWLAVALNQSPDILVLDEPTTYLDLYYQVKLMHLIQAIQRSQKLTVLMIFHDLNQVLQYADHCLLLNQGQLIAQGTPQTVLTVERIQDCFRLAAEIVPTSYGTQLYLKSEQGFDEDLN